MRRGSYRAVRSILNCDVMGFDSEPSQGGKNSEAVTPSFGTFALRIAAQVSVSDHSEL